MFKAIVKVPTAKAPTAPSALTEKQEARLMELSEQAIANLKDADDLFKRSTESAWHAGKYLKEAREILKASKGWRAWLKNNKIGKTRADEAIQLHQRFHSPADLKKFKTPTEAKLYAGIIAPRTNNASKKRANEERPSEVQQKAAATATPPTPVGALEGVRSLLLELLLPGELPSDFGFRRLLDECGQILSMLQHRVGPYQERLEEAVVFPEKSRYVPHRVMAHVVETVPNKAA
jgi:hypothetical protein